MREQFATNRQSKASVTMGKQVSHMATQLVPAAASGFTEARHQPRAGFLARETFAGLHLVCRCTSRFQAC